MIPYGRQTITQADIDAVLGVLQSDFLTQGPRVPAFEAALCEHTSALYATAVNSATSALHIACLALGLKPGGLLWTVPNSFVASANCGLYCGAKIDFVDIDPQTYNLSVEALSEKLARTKAAGDQLPDILVPVHFAGRPCDMPAIAALAAEYGFKVLEDASHAVGASLGGHRVGACAHSDIAVFSFHPVKIVTTGEGGAALTRCPALDERLKQLRTHGISRKPEHLGSDHTDPWLFGQVDLGFNYRMTDLAAALGRSQLEALPLMHQRRLEIVERYAEALADLSLQRPLLDDQRFASAWHLYVIHLGTEERRRAVFHGLRDEGIGSQVHYIPIHTHPFFRALGFGWGDFPVSEAYYRGALSLPLYPGLAAEQQAKVIDCLTRLLAP